MTKVELIPLNKGNKIILNDTPLTIIGRTSNTGCLDNKISRNHAQLLIKSNGTVWIKAIHHNPTFYKTKTNRVVTLTKDKEYQLYDSDQFGLLPDEYFYRILIKSNNEEKEQSSEQNQTNNSSTIPKTSIKDNAISTLENLDQENYETKNNDASDQNRSLPTWMSDNLTATTNEEKTLTTSSNKTSTYIETKKTKQIIYGSDDDEPSSSTDQARSSNNNDAATSNASASSSTTVKRERCPYGKECYRKNPLHLQQAIHPGDPDWDTEETVKTKTKPDCPYGKECYRKSAEHLAEYHHPKKRCIELKSKRSTVKRKTSEIKDDDDDDDDGLPNEYDYNDSFIDDGNLDDTDSMDDEDDANSDSDDEWIPEKKCHHFDEVDDNSTDKSDADLAKKEAEEFIKGSTVDRHSPVRKKPRIEEDDSD